MNIYESSCMLNVAVCYSHFADELTYTYIKVKTMGKNNNIGYIELDRPKVMNAIFDPLMMDVCSALDEFEANDDISCVILTGSTKAFSGQPIYSQAILICMSAIMNNMNIIIES